MILAGGVGSRFWPVSTPARPKQVLPLAGAEPLIRQTVERILPLVPPARIRVLTGAHLGAPILAAAPQLGTDSLLLEPRARGTAPALAWAAHALVRHDPAAVMISLHADHVIAPADAFRALLAEAAELSVRHQRLFTIGASPTRPETGYGYIRPGDALEPGSAARTVAAFVEKPDAPTAARYIAEGCLWNTGLFVWPAALLLEELCAHTPELAALLSLLDAGDDAGFFERAPELTIDVGLLERTDRVAVLPATFAWDDVGAWDAVARTRTADVAGNVTVGSVHAVQARDCVVWAEEGMVVLFDVADLVVVRANGITLVAPKARAADLKQLLEALPPGLAGGGSG
ncbi:MAG TPA: sugar phosphate nucleotidyltransferase [Longimicrobiales bacterium]|nr:sugar phosphate nucleotidyltransferase [Longimicrobiales bacterium]